MQNNRYTWFLLLLIPLLGIAYAVYKYTQHISKKTHHHEMPQPTIQEVKDIVQESQEPIIKEEQITQSIQQSEQNMPAFSAQELEDREIPESKQAIKQKRKKPKNLHERKEQIKKGKEEKPHALKPKTTKESAPSSHETKQIALHDELTKASFGYKHWSGRYYPSKFILQMNNEVILTFNGKEITHVKDAISINPEKPVLVRFDFEFLGGRRHGWKEVLYQIDKNANAITIDFDWKDPKDDQILLSPAKAISKKSKNNHDGK